MLNFLSIKNFALLEDALLEFSPGLSVLTGETGAGKTIVVEALGLALGAKAEARQVRQGAERMSVSAGFSLGSPRIKKLLKELDLPLDEKEGEVLLRRDVEAAGRSRSFINDHPVNLATLSRLGELLVDMHGQHEHQLLLKAAEQRDLLDKYGDLGPEREAVEEAYAEWRGLVSEREAMAISDQERSQRLDLYQYQLEELEAARLKPGEDEESEKLLPQLKNAEKARNLSWQAYGALAGEEGAAVGKLSEAARLLDALKTLGVELEEAPGHLQEALIRLEEAARSVKAFHDGVDLDPERLEEVLSRLDLIARMKKKYGPSLEDVLNYREKIRQELDRLKNVEAKAEDLGARISKSEANLKEKCEILSQARQKAAKKLTEAAQGQMKDLGLVQARFHVSVKKNAEGAYGAAGWDEILYLFAANPGEKEGPLSHVASGGELSRVMLALKTVLAKADPVDTLVFDEIDAGVGGAVGGSVGKKMARLAQDRQILCVTHLASIASQARSQFHVDKQVKSGRTRTIVRPLSEEERVAEIARMLGGLSADDKKSVSLEHARALLEQSKP